jgi:hypothetical protein
MERTHRWRDDRAWMPRRVRGIRWGITGAAWATSGAAVAGLAVVAPGSLLGGGWKFLAVAGAAAVGAGERAGAAMFKRELGKITKGQVELADLGARKHGELVCVRGKIVCEAPLVGLIVDAPGVYRRLIFETKGKWVHEAAVDFSLVDDEGKLVRVQAAGARWIHEQRELVRYPAHAFDKATIPSTVKSRVAGFAALAAHEDVLKVGTEVQIVGYKSATADVAGDVVDYRLPPLRASLESGPDLPLVISLP